MKCSLIILLISATCAMANDSYSQSARVTIDMKNAAVKDVLNEIEKTSEFYFLYSSRLIDVDRKVNIYAENQAIKDILDGLFASSNVDYVVIDRQIVLSPAGFIAKAKSRLQPITVTGQVTDENGEPLPGVAVMVKSTTRGTFTNVEGEYTIEVEDQASVLVFSFVGYATQEVTVGNQTEINVNMELEVLGLGDIVVIGYGTQKKTTLTGSVSTTRGEELAEMPVPNISQSMAGNLTGITMRPISGQPGRDTPELYIRGVVTTGNSEPLVVVDGVKRDNLQQLDVNSIESITVLKDASAVAPYGIGGANGVILITTKRGQTGKSTLRLSSSYSIQNPTYVPDLLNAKDYMALQNEAYYNLDPTGTTPPWDPAVVANYDQLHADDPWTYPNSNVIDETWNLNVPVQKYNFELSGGSESIRYHAGLGYYDQKGIFDPVNYKRYNYNVSVESDVTKTTNVSVSILGSVEERNEIDPYRTIASGGFLRGGYKWFPTVHLYYPDGEHWGENQGYSIVGGLKSDGYTKLNRNDLLASISINQELPFIEGLSVKGAFSYDPRQSNEKLWHIPVIWHKLDMSTDPYTFEEQLASGDPYIWLSQEHGYRVNYTYQGYINYIRSFGQHNVTALFVAEARNSTSQSLEARRNYFSVEIDELNLGPSDKEYFDNGGYSSTASEIGYVYRLGYNYKEKYLFEASGRYDGHYYFAPGKRWGYFPAFSAAWRISEENFMAGISQLNSLKIRGSWGKSGNLAGSAFQYLPGYSLRSNAYIFGSSTLVQSSRMTRENNPNITWEVGAKTDIGFDLIMWNSLLTLEFDYFHEDRDGMLLPPQVTLPIEYGLSLAEENKGKMKNNGFELFLGSRKMFSNRMELDVKLNFSYARNEMIEVFETEAQKDNPNRTLRGKPYGTPFGYKTDGLFSTDDDKNGDGIINEDDGYTVEQFGTLRPGDIKYVDLSGPDGVPDGEIDANDLIDIGYPYYPLMTYGLSAAWRWKGIDVSLFFQGSAMSSIDVQQWQTVPFANNGSNTGYEYFNNRWTPDNQDAKYPRAYPAPPSNNSQDSDFWQWQNSFLRLKTAIVGYSLPTNIVNKLRIGNIRVYLSGYNWLTISKLKHLDPEASYVGGDQGREDSYPQMKATTLGIDITF